MIADTEVEAIRAAAKALEDALKAGPSGVRVRAKQRAILHRDKDSGEQYIKGYRWVVEVHLNQRVYP